MKIHLLGICGTGMASLAGMLQSSGHQVTGSDQNVYPPMSTLLEKLHIPIFTPYAESNLSHEPELIIVGNALSRGNPEVEAMLQKEIPYLSMPQAIAKFFLAGKSPLVVAGTHGKTTTASLLAWVLESAGKDPSFFIGGVPKNFEQNFKLGKGEYFVLEGDEYDTAFFDKGPKFLHYQPLYVLLTSVEFDHADIYRDLEHVKSSFKKLIDIIPPQGGLVANLDFSAVSQLLEETQKTAICYAMESTNRERADYFAEMQSAGEKWHFCVFSRGEGGKECCHREISWTIPGKHNASNALGVIALCLKLGIPWEQIQKGLATFQGVKRRQELLGKPRGITVIDDFAHHPTAVGETIAAIRDRYPAQRLWAIFEPRSNTSKRDVFQREYSLSFLEADQVILADVFMPEKVKEGNILNVDAIVEQINRNRSGLARHISGVDSIVKTLCQETKPTDVILIMSNGGFGGIHGKLLECLEHAVD